MRMLLWATRHPLPYASAGRTQTGGKSPPRLPAYRLPSIAVSVGICPRKPTPFSLKRDFAVGNWGTWKDMTWMNRPRR